MARGARIVIDMNGRGLEQSLFNIFSGLGIYRPATIRAALVGVRQSWNDEVAKRVRFIVTRKLKGQIPIKTGKLRRSYQLQRTEGDIALVTMLLYGRWVQVRNDVLLYTTVKDLVRHLDDVLSGLAQAETNKVIARLNAS